MDVRKLLPIALITALLLTYLGVAQTKVFADSVVGTGTAASCTDDALATALAAGGTISFNCGSTPVTIQILSPKTISVDTVIDGNNLITLDGDGQSYFFYINNFQGVNVTVKNLNFVNGKSDQEGGAIHAHFKSNLTVINCTFTNNATTSATKQFDGGGGAIFVGSEATATIDGSTFTNNSGANGGAIYSLNSTLSIDSSAFIDNTANLTSTKSGSGGAIWNDTGPITVTNSLFSGNSALLQGGALAVSPDNTHPTGNFSVSNTTFTNNSSYYQNQGNGGAIFSQQPLSLVGSTFSGNKARVGGALWLGANATLGNDTIANNSAVSPDGQHGLGAGLNISSGTVSLINVTVASNYADFLGAGIFGKATVKNTIIANNVANNGGNNWNIQNQCSTAQTNGGHNIDFPLDDCGFGSSAVEDPKLGALANNGGSTQTMALLVGSPAIDAGDNTACAASPINNIDQRGVSRASNSPCDIGSYEFDVSQPTATYTPSGPTNTPTATVPTATPTNTPVPPTATLTNTPIPPTATKTRTPTATRTNTAVPATATNTRTPTATRTNTSVPPTATRTHTPLPPTATRTNTAVPTATMRPTVGCPTPSGYHRRCATGMPTGSFHAQVGQQTPINKSCSSTSCVTIPLDIYCTTAGISVYDSGANSQVVASVLQIKTALAQAITSHENVVVAQGTNDSLYALPSNELQAVGPEIDDPQKTYIFTFRPADFPASCTWFNTLQAVATLMPTADPASRLAAQGTQTYVVQVGDTVARIAQHFGVSLQALVDANGISDPSHIIAGQTLVIPNGGTVATAKPTQSIAATKIFTPTNVPPTATPPMTLTPVPTETVVPTVTSTPTDLVAGVYTTTHL